LVASVLSVLTPKLSTRLGIDKTCISTLPDVVADYIADPLRTEAVSMRWGTEIMKVMPATREAAARFPVPLLVMHGADDPITSPEGSRAFVAACGHPDHRLIVYPGCRHEVHHDVGRPAFERDLTEWLTAHAQPHPAAFERGETCAQRCHCQRKRGDRLAHEQAPAAFCPGESCQMQRARDRRRR
jgi:alpha-beta hydrolase superfamily lysophospholipase